MSSSSSPSPPDLLLRPYAPQDAAVVDAIALSAFEQFRDAYEDWEGFRGRIRISALAGTAEVIVAELGGVAVGAVAYVAPHQPKAAFFRPEWPVMRMLVVHPAAQGHGIGRRLAEECLIRARRDGAKEFALHTASVMRIALPMYERMGFRLAGAAPAIHGVPYGIYLLDLERATPA